MCPRNADGIPRQVVEFEASTHQATLDSVRPMGRDDPGGDAPMGSSPGVDVDFGARARAAGTTVAEQRALLEAS